MRKLKKEESLLKYAQDIFNAIKTSIPTLNELTLDFTKFIHSHYEELEEQFVKDMFFIHGKSMIEFLDSLKQIEQEKEEELRLQRGRDLCQEQLLKSLYQKYLLAIKMFLSESAEIVTLRK